MDLTPAALAAQARELVFEVANAPGLDPATDAIATALGAVCDAARAECAEEIAALKEKLAAIDVLREEVMGKTIVRIVDRRLERAEAAEAERAEEVRQLREALWAYRSAQRRMLAQWADGDYAVKVTLWQHLHVCEVAANALLDAATEPSHG